MENLHQSAFKPSFAVKRDKLIDSSDEQVNSQLLIKESNAEEEESKDIQLIVQAEDEPFERTSLPWLKDPAVKAGVWSIIKDNFGKDLSSIAVPVYFNDPTNLL